MMRKNVIKVPRKNSAASATGKRRRLNEEEDKVADFFETTPKHADAPTLALPTISNKAAAK